MGTQKANLALRLLVSLIVMLLLLSGAVAAASYAYVAHLSLPPLDPGRSLQFENTQIMASNHKLLYDMPDPNTGNRVVKPLELNPNNQRQCPQGKHTRHLKPYYTCSGHGIPRILRDATIATEDPTFYSNPGFDPMSIVRAAYTDLLQGRVAQGGSTITQQFVKLYVLDNSSTTVTRKVKELILAWQMTQKYPKDFILWYYLNSVYYGHLAYGVQAAAKTYFHVGVQNLKLWQAAMIAGLPQSPNSLDPFNDPGVGGAWYARTVLVLSYLQSRHYITVGQERRAEANAGSYNFREVANRMKQRKFVTYVIDQFQAMTDPNSATFDPYLFQHLHKLQLYDGLRIVTTLDPPLQRLGEETVHSHVAELAAEGYLVTDGALVSVNVRPGCYGCIMAMVGSANVDKGTTSINMANSPRQPGSSFKPFNYVSAFAKGLSPGSSVYDEPLSIPDRSEPSGVYTPANYGLTYHGLVSLRLALANSLNVPAVKVELFNGVHSVASTAHRFGITDLWHDNPVTPGYALTLGGLYKGVRLVQETGAYGAFATQGIRVPTISFREIISRRTGRVLWRANDDTYLKSLRKRVAPASDVFMVNSILSDNNARVMEFGYGSPLQLDRPDAAKTGTTENFTDNWTVGFTPGQMVTGVWVGNANNSPMGTGVNGVTGAAPIWHDFMESAFGILQLPVANFPDPSTVPGLSYGSQCVEPNLQSLAYANFLNGPDYYDTDRIPYCSVPTVTGLDDQPGTNYVQPTPGPPPVVFPTPTPPPVVIIPGNGQGTTGQQPPIISG